MMKLCCEKGMLGDIRVSLESNGKQISLGNVQSWEDQEEVVKFVNHVNRELYQLNSAYVCRLPVRGKP